MLNPQNSLVLKTPIGPMIAAASARGLCALDHDLPKQNQRLAARLRKWYEPAELTVRGNPHLEALQIWLDAYSAGRWQELPPLATDARGTDFELSVWQVLVTIPLGTVITYTELAAAIGKPNAARAVGGASSRNPISIVVPCHRVIGRSGSLTGYAGGVEHKSWLLAHEQPSK